MDTQFFPGGNKRPPKAMFFFSLIQGKCFLMFVIHFGS